jgi:hypothetical protein
VVLIGLPLLSAARPVLVAKMVNALLVKCALAVLLAMTVVGRRGAFFLNDGNHINFSFVF